jgi:chromate reductase
MSNKTIKILALPGSLRAGSSSNVVMRAAANVLPENVELNFFEGVGKLPHFDDSNEVPEAVLNFRNKLKEADAVFICTPEYAFGVPGSLKNALDWTVSSAEFVNKPVALVTASSSGEKGHAALLLILTALSAHVVPEATLLIPFIRAKVKNGELIDGEILNQLRIVVKELVESI